MSRESNKSTEKTKTVKQQKQKKNSMVPLGVQKPGCKTMRNSSLMDAYDSSDDINPPTGGEEEPRPETLLREAFLKIPGDSWKAKLEHCATCTCCIRHQILRPTKFVQWCDEASDTTVQLHDKVPTCPCDCRHMARFICRQVGTPCPIKQTEEEDKM